MTHDAPGIGVEAVHRIDGCAVRQEILGAERGGVAGSRVRVNLGLLTLLVGADEETHRTVRAVEPAFVGDHFVLAREDQVLGDDLRDADAVTLGLHLFLERRIVADVAVRVLDVAEHVVLAVLEGEGNRGEVAEHVVAHAREHGLRLVITLVAVDVADAVRGLAVQKIQRKAALGTLVGVGTRRGFDVDRCRGHHVDVVVGRHGHVFADALAHQHRGAVDDDAAAVVAEIQHVRAIFRQHAGTRDAARGRSRL